jgi:hypothetical protein
MKRNIKRHPDNIIWLDENCIDKESITAADIVNLCKEISLLSPAPLFYTLFYRALSSSLV